MSYVVSQLMKRCIRCGRKASILWDREAGRFLVAWEATATRPLDIDEVPNVEMVFDPYRGDGYCK